MGDTDNTSNSNDSASDMPVKNPCPAKDAPFSYNTVRPATIKQWMQDRPLLEIGDMVQILSQNGTPSPPYDGFWQVEKVFTKRLSYNRQRPVAAQTAVPGYCSQDCRGTPVDQCGQLPFCFTTYVTDVETGVTSQVCEAMTSVNCQMYTTQDQCSSDACVWQDPKGPNPDGCGNVQAESRLDCKNTNSIWCDDGGNYKGPSKFSQAKCNGFGLKWSDEVKADDPLYPTSVFHETWKKAAALAYPDTDQAYEKAYEQTYTAKVDGVEKSFECKNEGKVPDVLKSHAYLVYNGSGMSLFVWEDSVSDVLLPIVGGDRGSFPYHFSFHIDKRNIKRAHVSDGGRGTVTLPGLPCLRYVNRDDLDVFKGQQVQPYSVKDIGRLAVHLIPQVFQHQMAAAQPAGNGEVDALGYPMNNTPGGVMSGIRFPPNPVRAILYETTPPGTVRLAESMGNCPSPPSACQGASSGSMSGCPSMAANLAQIASKIMDSVNNDKDSKSSCTNDVAKAGFSALAKGEFNTVGVKTDASVSSEAEAGNTLTQGCYDELLSQVNATTVNMKSDCMTQNVYTCANSGTNITQSTTIKVDDQSMCGDKSIIAKGGSSVTENIFASIDQDMKVMITQKNEAMSEMANAITDSVMSKLDDAATNDSEKSYKGDVGDSGDGQASNHLSVSNLVQTACSQIANNSASVTIMQSTVQQSLEQDGEIDVCTKSIEVTDGSSVDLDIEPSISQTMGVIAQISSGAGSVVSNVDTTTISTMMSGEAGNKEVSDTDDESAGKKNSEQPTGQDEIEELFNGLNQPGPVAVICVALLAGAAIIIGFAFGGADIVKNAGPYVKGAIEAFYKGTTGKAIKAAEDLQNFFGNTKGGMIVLIAIIVIFGVLLLAGIGTGAYFLIKALVKSTPSDTDKYTNLSLEVPVTIPYSPAMYLGDDGMAVMGADETAEGAGNSILPWNSFKTDEKRRACVLFEAARRTCSTGGSLQGITISQTLLENEDAETVCSRCFDEFEDDEGCKSKQVCSAQYST